MYKHAPPTPYQPADPTEDEIRAKCAAIQMTWSTDEWAIRAGYDKHARKVGVKIINTSEIERP